MFPSAALAWKMKEESFLKDVKWVEDVKLRLGWGKTGQQEGIGDYTYMPTFTPNQDHAYYGAIKDANGNGVTYRPDAFNTDLTWEKTTTWNAGLDFSFFRDRWILNLDWYYRKTTDLINSVYVSAGLTSATRLQATSVLCIIQVLSWRQSFVLSRQKT